MKKFLTFLLVVGLMAALLAGCQANGTEPAPNGEPAPAQPGAEGAVKTGLAVTASLAKSTEAAADQEGLVQADSIIVAVTVGADGKIVDCAIDSAQSKVNFDAAGKITTPLDSEFRTKNELGTDYGMLKSSGIGKEWNEQAAALADYVIGKTADEVRGIAVDAETHPTDADLKASVTIAIGGYIETIVKAVENAAELGAAASDRISVGTETGISRSTDAGGEAGLIEVYSTYAAITTDAAGKITSCVIDATQAKANFDAAGKITSDLNAAVQTKNEIGEGYGLKAVSSIGKEWNEQAAAFAGYAAGKTAAEVQGIAVNEESKPTGADLTASVTISINDFQAAIAKAAQ